MSTHNTTNTMENYVSGQGPNSRVPDEVKGWCWGGFLWGFIWAIGNKTWVGLLGMFPIANIVVPFVLGIKGREWAWQNNNWKSVQHFKTVQKKWVYWWLGFAGVTTVVTVIAVYRIVLPSYKFIQSAQAAGIDQSMSQLQMNASNPQFPESVPLTSGDRIALQPQTGKSGASVKSANGQNAAVKNSSIETIVFLEDNSGNSKLLKVAIAFKYDDEKYPGLDNEISQRRTQFYNILYKRLSSLSAWQVTGSDAEDHIRNELCQTMNAALPSESGKISEVVFTEFSVE